MAKSRKPGGKGAGKYRYWDWGYFVKAKKLSRERKEKFEEYIKGRGYSRDVHFEVLEWLYARFKKNKNKA